MKQHTDNLVKRLDSEFEIIETSNLDKLSILIKKLEVATILVQELQTHVAKYKLIQSEKDQINYYKDCLPLIQKWVYAIEFLLSIEKESILGTNEMKAEYYKNGLLKLNCSYKKRCSEFAYIRQNDKYFESSTLLSSNLNNDIIATFQAHFIAEEYLLKAIANYNNEQSKASYLQVGYSTYKWVKTKTDLAELCYALYYGNCIIDTKTQKPVQLINIATTLQSAFSAELKDYKRLFSDIKKRKMNESFTKYLQQTIQHQIEINFK